MKISRTKDGQISIDLFSNRKMAILVGVFGLGIVPAIFFVSQMQKFGLGWSHLAGAPVEVAEAVTYDVQKETATTPVTQPETVSKPPDTKVPPVSQSQAIADYKAGLFAIDGMTDLVSDIRSGYGDGQVEIWVTPYFENQPKATRQDFAQSFWRAWVISSQYQEQVDRAHIRLTNSSGQKIGGSRSLAGSIIYVDE